MYLVAAEPDNPQFHACFADLSIAQGLITKGANEYKKAGELGLAGMYEREFRVRKNFSVLTRSFLYVPGTIFDTPQDDLLDHLREASIPGTNVFKKKICKDVDATFEAEKGRGQFDGRTTALVLSRVACDSQSDADMQFNDCF